jgi:predicted nucleic acid-binding protein
MIVVSNSSPLILLSKLGHFDLLRRLFNAAIRIGQAGIPAVSNRQNPERNL